MEGYTDGVLSLEGVTVFKSYSARTETQKEVMKKSVMKKWVKALRSGKYTQARNSLRADSVSYCCLGVLCDISKVGQWEVAGFYHCEESREYGVLPEAVQKYAGIRHQNGTHAVSKKTLTSMNDLGKSFKYIAAYIEKNYKKL